MSLGSQEKAMPRSKTANQPLFQDAGEPQRGAKRYGAKELKLLNVLTDESLSKGSLQRSEMRMSGQNSLELMPPLSVSHDMQKSPMSRFIPRDNFCKCFFPEDRPVLILLFAFSFIQGHHSKEAWLEGPYFEAEQGPQQYLHRPQPNGRAEPQVIADGADLTVRSAV